MGQLNGRTALVTGANRGIGFAIAQAYVREGARCIVSGRNPAAVRDAAARLAGDGEVIALDLDLERPASVAAAISAVVALGRLDILVANGALLGARAPMLQYPLDLWRQVFQANVHANLQLIQGLDPLLRASDAGRVIFVISGAARRLRPGGGSYAATKGALEVLAGIYALEVASTRIRVNLVAPQPTRTDMRALVAPDEDPLTLKTPQDIAPLFVELAAPGCVRHGERIDADEWLAKRPCQRRPG
jgi:NAD(P)-dependent dehydrogenase (short-subunit alcohol dehydrogenase family)